MFSIPVSMRICLSTTLWWYTWQPYDSPEEMIINASSRQGTSRCTARSNSTILGVWEFEALVHGHCLRICSSRIAGRRRAAYEQVSSRVGSNTTAAQGEEIISLLHWLAPQFRNDHLPESAPRCLPTSSRKITSPDNQLLWATPPSAQRHRRSTRSFGER